MANVLVIGPVHQAAIDLLESRPDITMERLDFAEVADLDQRIADLDAILLRLTKLHEATIDRARHLKVVARYGVGFDTVDVDALTRRGIPLTVIGTANSTPVAEHAVGMMLALTHRLALYDGRVRNDRFFDRDPTAQTELWRKTVLIVGYGRIGARVAKRLSGFDMDIVVADPNVARSAIESQGYKYVSDFHDALADADILTLHMPALPDRRPVITHAELSAMPRGSVLINTARGSLVDESDLVDALRSGQLAAAGLDVLINEPPVPDHPLLAMDNVLLSPHSAAMTAECFERASLTCVRNILNGLDGTLDPEFVVNPEVLSAQRDQE